MLDNKRAGKCRDVSLLGSLTSPFARTKLELQGVAKMSCPVFISYSRGSSAAHAQALAARLGDLVFLDSGAIDDGDEFPQRLLDGILEASVVVIFATQTYSE